MVADALSEREVLSGIRDYTGRDWDDFSLSEEQCLDYHVKYRCGRNKKFLKLREIAEGGDQLREPDPAYLDLLLDRAEPGTELFYALTVVCDHYRDEVGEAAALRCQNLRDQNTGIVLRKRHYVRCRLREDVKREFDGQAEKSD